MRERLTEDAVDSPTPLSLAAFSATVERRQASLYGFLHGLLGDPEQARDLTQDTFHDAWRTNQTGAPPWTIAHDDDERRRWLFQVAYRRAISQLRRRKIIRWASLDWPGFMDRAPEDASVPELLDDAISFEQRVVEAEAMRTALARLTPDDAACLLLRVAHGFSAAEVASVLGVTTDAVAQRLSRARRRLRSVYLAQNPLNGADATDGADGAASRNRRARAERSDGDE
ncbi:MAG TPA: sigma-70 family RNA polymerase sigma factor [Ktedonobacterales bacterium]|nr:sigma-70 family RNA polymerase sigma factor [Ktedonobacterales bacterium]